MTVQPAAASDIGKYTGRAAAYLVYKNENTILHRNQ